MYSKTKIKTKLIATLVAVFMLFSNIAIAIGSLIKKQTFNLVEAYSTKIDVTNGNFNSPNITSGSSLPASVSNWTTVAKPESVTAGIITLDTQIATDSKIENSYKLETLPKKYTGMSDNQILMMNAGTSQANAGYKSGTLTLDKASFYVFSFKAYTENSATACAKLTGVDALEKIENIVRINTNGTWNDYKIFVETSSTTSISPNLELWLGSKGEYTSTGAVFFDDVNIYRYDNLTFATMLSAETKNFVHINLNKNYVQNFIENADFEAELEDSWTLIENSNLNAGNETINGRVNVETFNKEEAKIDDDIKNTNIAGNKYALLINNLKSGYVGYKSSYFTAEAKAIYKLSFLAKSNANATVKLVERNPYTNEFLSDGVTANPNYYANSSYEAQSFEMSNISTKSYTNEFTNNWQEYSFYIKSNNLIDTEMNLELWLGTENANQSGYVLFDHFTIQKITSDEFTSNSSNGTVADFNQNTTSTDFANGTFNLVKIEDVENSYPYAPESWTLTASKTEASAKNGVVNTNEDNLSLEIPTIPAINNKYPNNNVLMIGNLSSNNQKYTSSSVTIGANSFAKITAKVLTTDLVNAKAGIRLVANSTVLGEILNIDTDGEWQTYTMLVKTGYQDVSVNLELSLGQNKEGTGFAFFDNILYSNTLTEEDYNSDTVSKKINLAQNDWTNTFETSTKGLMAPYDWTGSNSSDASVTAGVIDTAKYGEEDGYNASSLTNPGHPEETNSNVLMIKSLDDAFYTYKSNSPYKLTSGSYYKVEVQVLTDNISHAEVEDEDNHAFGASINLNGIEATFKGIDTKGEWKAYSIYINCTEDSNIYVELSLGSENNLTSGVAYFSTVEVTQIDADKYQEEVKALEDDATIDNVLAIGNTDAQETEDDTQKDEEKTSDNSVNFNWLLVPSIITAVAILFAVVGVVYRNVKKKSPKKAKLNKPYSKDNLKKLSNSHKAELKHLDEQKADLAQKQNRIAVELNKARRAGSENVASLEREYASYETKLAELEEKRKEFNKKYKQKVEDLKKLENLEKGNR